VVDVAVTEAAALANWYRRATLIGVGTLLALVCWAFLLRRSSTQFQRLFESESELKHLAHYDQLTELANRVSLQNDLNEAIQTNHGSAARATSIAIRSATVCCRRWHGGWGSSRQAMNGFTAWAATNSS
jgi:predicted signal transduction protein with EAL and GGDEF domain